MKMTNGATGVKEKSVLKFFLLVFILSIPLWIIETQIDIKGLPLDIPITDILAAFTPLLAACILIYHEEGRSGVHKLFKQLVDYRKITTKVWCLIILLPLLIFLSIFFVIQITGLPLPEKWQVNYPSIPFLISFFLLGAAGEEAGYMGYAIEPIQRKWNSLVAGIIIGIPWAMWHYPSMLQQGRSITWMIWGTLGTVAMRLLIIRIYNEAAKSIFACILFHALYNTGRVLFPRDNIFNPLVDYPEIHYMMILLATFIIYSLWGDKSKINQ